MSLMRSPFEMVQFFYGIQHLSPDLLIFLPISKLLTSLSFLIWLSVKLTRFWGSWFMVHSSTCKKMPAFEPMFAMFATASLKLLVRM